VQTSAVSGVSIPALDPDARHVGHDASGQVQVEIDGAARRVVVSLETGWRRAISGDGLGPAVLAAFTAATTARLTTLAEQAADHRHVESAPAPVSIGRPHATEETLRLLSRAFRDLHEYRHLLTELHATTTRRTSRGQTVVVTVRAGEITEIELDPDWLQAFGDADIERQIGHTMTTALDDLARLPERALENCPDLRAVLAVQQPAPDR
jgi:hypothetical protein